MEGIVRILGISIDWHALCWLKMLVEKNVGYGHGPGYAHINKSHFPL